MTKLVLLSSKPNPKLARVKFIATDNVVIKSRRISSYTPVRTLQILNIENEKALLTDLEWHEIADLISPQEWIRLNVEIEE